MMLRVNGEYLDFNGDIEIEKKIKLFEEIDSEDGDFSFAFQIEMTSRNIAILNKPFPDSSSKTVFVDNDTEVLNDEGHMINRGRLRLERISGLSPQGNQIASCSFFGGNNNWFAMLTGTMPDLNLSAYDTDLTEANIVSSWTNTEGLIFPLVDSGTLITRGFANSVTEDFVGMFYAHTLLKEVFKQCGLKIQGELMEDPFFLSLVVAANGRSESDINDRKSYVSKTTPQTAPPFTDPPDIVTFDNDSVLPYFDGSQNNFDLSLNRYTADVKMTLRLSFTFNTDGNILNFYLYKNGVEIDRVLLFTVSSVTKSFIVDLEAGDYIDVRVKSIGSSTDILNGNITITPIFVYRAFGSSNVPTWTKQEFVSNIFSLFNTISTYDSFTKTVTVNLFDKIKEKEPIDISQFITITETDYAEFISNYGQRTIITYQEGNDVDMDQYNISDFMKTIEGEIEVNNDYIEENAEALEGDFSSPVSYKSPAFGNSMERIQYLEFAEDESVEITSVTDSSGTPRFQISDADDTFVDGQIVRLETDVPEYNGDFVITTVTSTYIEVRGLEYTSDAIGEAISVRHAITTDDNVYLFSMIRSTPTEYIFGREVYLNDTNEANFSVAFFNMLRLGNTIEESYKQGLSLSDAESPYQYQRTLIDRYWRQFARILNDPVMQRADGYLPLKTYNDINFQRPITIRTLETSNMYYMNRNTGYRDSSVPCLIELIKLP